MHIRECNSTQRSIIRSKESAYFIINMPRGSKYFGYQALLKIRLRMPEKASIFVSLGCNL